MLNPLRDEYSVTMCECGLYPFLSNMSNGCYEYTCYGRSMDESKHSWQWPNRRDAAIDCIDNWNYPHGDIRNRDD